MTDRVESVYLEAAARPPSDRAAWLDRECAAEPEVRSEVESLLAADLGHGGFLELPPFRLAADLFAQRPQWPEFIGPYRILGVLGEGGMGVVFKAEQNKPQRLVALKVIRTPLMSSSVLRRFEFEAAALARLQHPGIAQVYDAGAGTPPYFAMELIEGEPLLAHAAALSLSTRQRLELMAKVCDAVNHAHQRGILHRDLKPGNILVDGSGQPKVLDFGVARILDSDSQATRQTDLGQLIGTIDYMSPEQTLGDSLGVDVRSDIYSLGVILYQLLAGQLPYETRPNETRQCALPELLRAIREDDAIPLGAMHRDFRGDIETIVHKTLAKEPHKRYASASELGDDLRRYLTNEPILAVPASAAYRARKFVRRYRTGVIAAAVLAAVIVGFGVGMALLAARNARERDIAQSERSRADAVVDFLLKDVLAQADDLVQSGPKPDANITVRQALDRAGSRVQGRFGQQPLVEASVRQTIGETYTRIGIYPYADQHLARALEMRRRLLPAGHPDLVSSMLRLGFVRRGYGSGDHGVSLLEEGIRTGTAALGETNPIVLEAMSELADTYGELAQLQKSADLFDKVLVIRRRVLGPDDPGTIDAMGNVAASYAARGMVEQAEVLYLQVIEAGKRLNPVPRDPISNLGNLYLRMGRFQDAEPHLQRAMQIAAERMNEEHPYRLYVQDSLGSLYRDLKRFREAEALFQTSMQVRRRVLGPENRSTLIDVSLLGDLYCIEGKWAEGEKMLLEAVRLQRRLLTDADTYAVRSMAALGQCYLRQHKFAEAEPWAATVARLRRPLGLSNPQTRDALMVLADIRERQGSPAEAATLLKEACPEVPPSRDWRESYCDSLRGRSLASANSMSLAKRLVASGYQGLFANQSHMPAGRLMHIADAKAALETIGK